MNIYETAATIELQWRYFAAHYAWNQTELRALSNARFKTEMDYVLNRLVSNLTAGILARPLKRVEVRYPADWWEAVKERWAPVWFLRRWPVEENVKVIEVEDIYPNCNLKLPVDRYGLPHRIALLNGNQLSR